MPIYIVLGRDATGKYRPAKVKADSPELARERAERNGLTVETVALDTSDPSMTEPRGGVAPPPPPPIAEPPPTPPPAPVVTAITPAPQMPPVQAVSVAAPQRPMEPERVVYVAKGTSIPTITAFVVFLVFAGITALFVLSGSIILSVLIGGIAFLTGIRAVWTYLVWKSTTLTITNRRVFGKQGVISTTDISLLHDKVESFSVRQGVNARMFGYGDILISGTGQGRIAFLEIDNPFVVRRALEEAVEATRHARQSQPQIVYIQAPPASQQYTPV